MELWELVARESCRDTLAQYTHAGDRYLLEEFAAAFCEDGVLEIRGERTAAGPRRHHGALRRHGRRRSGLARRPPGSGRRRPRGGSSATA